MSTVPTKLAFGLVPATCLALAGCGGSSTDGLSDAISEATAAYAVLDLSTRTYEWRTSIPELLTDAEFRTSKIAFRRVPVGSTEVMVGVFELTQAQWEAIDLGSTPWTAVPDEVCAWSSSHQDDHPAYNLDHETVATALAAFALPTGSLAIPTAAQWQAACGTSSGWSWGATATQAQLEANAVVRESVVTIGRLTPGGTYQQGVDTGGPLAVGSKAASPLGLYDLHGNVWELISGGEEVRGGSWRDTAWSSRVEVGAGADEGVHQELDHALIGVRLVLVP